MLIEIKHRFTGEVIVSGDCESVKVLLENNRGANLYMADLEGADLEGADLEGANLREANLYLADLYMADLYMANLREANLKGADLRGVNLEGADLKGADLRGVNLEGVNLEGVNLEEIKEYDSSMTIFVEIIRRLDQSMFTQKEWAAIGKGITNGVCWENIKEKFGDTMHSIFKKLAKVGYDEWLKHWETLD